MPIHDWTRVSAGTFHAFHVAWVGLIQTALNSGRLPPGYYAMAEQIIGPFGPDVLALRSPDREDEPPDAVSGGVATVAKLQTMPVTAPIVADFEGEFYTSRRRTIAIRHSSEDQVVALIEIVSSGNKDSRHAIRSFLDKAVEALARGLHLLLVDLHPPGPRDPQGIHGALWSEMADDSYRQPADQPLTVASYRAGPPKTTAHVYPVAVGQLLPPAPLFLTADGHIPVPLEETYQEAYRGMPFRWRRVLETTPG